MSVRGLAATLLIVLTASLACAADVPADRIDRDSPRADSGPMVKEAVGRPVPLNKEGTVLLDAKNRKLIIETEVVLREGMLEMLLCKRHTKEHESILAFDGKAYILHAGLVAMGLDPGKPVSFNPEYTAPKGPELKIEVVWADKEGQEHRQDARQWVRRSIHRFFGEPLERIPEGLNLPFDGELKYDSVNKELSWYGPMSDAQRDELLALSKDAAYRKAIASFHQRTRSRAMESTWVFAGSTFAVNEATGSKVYLAESGDVICVANFPSAMVDVADRSSAEGQENLLYEAWTERLPPVGTAVRLEITPVENRPLGEKPRQGAGRVRDVKDAELLNRSREN